MHKLLLQHHDGNCVTSSQSVDRLERLRTSTYFKQLRRPTNILPVLLNYGQQWSAMSYDPKQLHVYKLRC